MPAVWQSSQRPMYIRTVWVDGFRHALLTHDDPYYLTLRRHRPHSSASNRTSHANINQTKFNFIISSNKSKIAQKRPKTSREPRVERLNLTDVEQDESEFALKINQQTLYDLDSCRSKFDSLCCNMKTIRSNRTTRSEVKEDTDLSDRVLQWLDLAGKIDLLAPENAERMTQPRHSWPEIQKKNQLVKCKTAIDIRARENCGGKLSSKDSPNSQQSGVIDRHDFCIPTSANTIEVYAQQSRHKKTPRTELNAKATDPNKTVKDFKANVRETRQKMASERIAVEKQYKELVSRKLIPDLSKNKKQVHIFMPELPKKYGSNATSRTESLLSQFSK